MANNTLLNAGTGGDTIQTEDNAGVKTQIVKPAFGTAGTVTLASASNPFPVVQTGTHAVNATLTAETTKVIGTVNIAAGDNNIGNVDLASAIPAGANLIGSVTAVGGAAENAAVSGNPVLVGGRYDSSPRTLGNGDVGGVALNASGQVLVEIAAGAGTGGTSAADDADFVDGTTSGNPIMGVYESTPSSVTDGDMGMVGITSTRAMRVSAENGITGRAVDSVAGSTDEGILAVLVRDDVLATLTPADGDYTQGRTNARGAQWVCLDTTAAQTVTLAAGTATNEVVGDAAHGAAAAGNPVLVGVEGRSTAPTAVDDGDVVRALATLLGKQVIYPYALPASAWTYASAAAVTDTADDEAKAAVASTRNYVTGIQVFNGHDTTGTEVVIKDGSTVLWRGWAEQTGGGCSARFDPPLRGTANTAINVANITNSSSTYFNLQGFTATE